jgi:hypothetical protein
MARTLPRSSGLCKAEVICSWQPETLEERVEVMVK